MQTDELEQLFASFRLPAGTEFTCVRNGEPFSAYRVNRTFRRPLSLWHGYRSQLNHKARTGLFRTAINEKNQWRGLFVSQITDSEDIAKGESAGLNYLFSRVPTASESERWLAVEAL